MSSGILLASIYMTLAYTLPHWTSISSSITLGWLLPSLKVARRLKCSRHVRWLLLLICRNAQSGCCVVVFPPNATKWPLSSVMKQHPEGIQTQSQSKVTGGDCAPLYHNPLQNAQSPVHGVSTLSMIARLSLLEPSSQTPGHGSLLSLLSISQVASLGLLQEWLH